MMGVRHANSPPESRPGEESETACFSLTLHSELPGEEAQPVSPFRNIQAQSGLAAVPRGSRRRAFDALQDRRPLRYRTTLLLWENLDRKSTRLNSSH